MEFCFTFLNWSINSDNNLIDLLSPIINHNFKSHAESRKFTSIADLKLPFYIFLNFEQNNFLFTAEFGFYRIINAIIFRRDISSITTFLSSA